MIDKQESESISTRKSENDNHLRTMNPSSPRYWSLVFSNLDQDNGAKRSVFAFPQLVEQEHRNELWLKSHDLAPRFARSLSDIHVAKMTHVDACRRM